MGRRGLQLGSHRSSAPGRREWAVADCSWGAICHVFCHSYLSILLSFLSVISSGMYFGICSVILICYSYLSYILSLVLAFLSVISSVSLIRDFLCHVYLSCHLSCLSGCFGWLWLVLVLRGPPMGDLRRPYFGIL